jgi:UDP-N-acetylmuramate dehydrogenase
LSLPIFVQENVPLAPLTTLGIGGGARFFVRAVSEQQVVEAFDFAAANDLSVFVLGGGSNVLISDHGFDGLALQIGLKGIEKFREKDGIVYVTAGAGEDWDEFVRSCVADDLQGIECLSGIPGFVGGTPVQNVGAYGQEVSETMVSVRVFDRAAREIVTLANADCNFTYRTSIFNTTENGRYVVLSVTYALKFNGVPKIVYKDLKETFGEKTPSLAETREAVLRIRRAKSMVIDESDPNSRSAGSFFKNPIVSLEAFERVQKVSDVLGFGPVPSYRAGEEKVKIPAAWLIERAGFSKGYKKGNAGLSANHTLALINLGQAAASDILALKDEIEAGVQRAFSISLKTEPIFVGF